MRRSPLFISMLALAACAPARPADAPLDLPAMRVQQGSQPAEGAALLAAAANARFVCVGEQHDDPAHHRFQYAMLSHLAARATERHAALALGMEMFQRQYQPALDDYIDGHLGNAELFAESDWKGRWGFDYAMYLPMLQLARERHMPVLALNAPREITRRVAKEGLQGIPDGLRAHIPQMDLEDQAHRRFFWAAMGFDQARSPHHGPSIGSAPSKAPAGRGHPAADPERLYAAQVLWDETMAQTAATWLAASEDGQLMAVAGNGHCHEHAIARRIKRRLPATTTLSVLVLGSDDEASAHASADFVVRLASR